MPQPLPEIQGVDNTQNWLAATRAGITDRQLLQNQEIQNQNRLLNQNVGNALAGGDLDEASNIAARGGNIDLYGQLQKWSKQASDDELAKVAKAHEVTTDLLNAIANQPDPNKQQMFWEQAKKTASDLGMPQDEIDKLDQMTKKFGISGALNFEAARVGKGAEITKNAQAQRQQANKDIGQSFAALSPDDEAGHVQVLQNLAKQGNSQAAQYLTPEGELVPGARASALGQAGLGSDVMRNQAKADQAANKPAGGGKQLALNAGTQRVVDEFTANHPEWKGRETEIGGLAQTAYQNKTGLDLGDDGKPKLASAAGTMLNYRSQQQNPDLQREISEYKTLGKEDGALAQRKAIAGGALNHLETVSQISDGELENALGVIHGSGGYQKFADLVNSGRVENSAAYRNAKQTLAVLTREVENAYHIAGTGADTDSRMAETKEALSPESLMQSPNTEVFRQRLNNIRAILQGVINSPRPTQFGSRSPNTAGSASTEEEVRRVSGAPEKGGQVQRLQPGKVYQWNPAKGVLE